MKTLSVCFLILASVFAAAAPPATQGWKGQRLLFLGNSITLHGPAPEIGWVGNWGMAASTAEKDYVHLVVDEVAKLCGRRPAFRAVNIADFERGYDGFDVAGKVKETAGFRADTVIVAIGENVPALSTPEAKGKFKSAMVGLLRLLKANGKKTVFVRSCFWPDSAKDTAMREACAEAGGVFIDIGGLSKDQRNYARSERKIANEGVGGHPGDTGMRAIADAIVEAMKRH
jgi:hypothetical protein